MQTDWRESVDVAIISPPAGLMRGVMSVSRDDSDCIRSTICSVTIHQMSSSAVAAHKLRRHQPMSGSKLLAVLNTILLIVINHRLPAVPVSENSRNLPGIINCLRMSSFR